MAFFLLAVEDKTTPTAYHAGGARHAEKPAQIAACTVAKPRSLEP